MQIADSIVCHSELSYNQSLMMIESLDQPLNDFGLSVERIVDWLNDLQSNYEKPLERIVGAINESANYMETVKKEIVSYEEVFSNVLINVDCIV